MTLRCLNNRRFSPLFIAPLLLVPLSAVSAQETTPAISETQKTTEPQPAAPLLIPRGTKVTVVLLEDVRSKQAKKGATIPFQVVSDVMSPEGKRLLPAGTPATGTVTDARRAGMFGRPGRITVACENLTVTDPGGRPISIPVTSEGKIKIENYGRDSSFASLTTAGTLGILTGIVVDVFNNFSLTENSHTDTADHIPGVLAGISVTTLVGYLWRGSEATLKRGTAFIVVVNEDSPLSVKPPEPTQPAP